MLMITGGAVGIIMYNVWLFGTKHWDVEEMRGYEFKMGADLTAGFKNDDTGIGDQDVDTG